MQREILQANIFRRTRYEEEYSESTAGDSKQDALV
jgi:hypothetical protein